MVTPTCYEKQHWLLLDCCCWIAAVVVDVVVAAIVVVAILVVAIVVAAVFCLPLPTKAVNGKNNSSECFFE